MTQTRLAQLHPQDSSEKIRSVALELFIERGYDNTPVSLIARRLGITKATIYHHFESKEELLHVIHRDYIERLMAPILTKTAAGPDPEARVNIFITEFTLMLASNDSARLLVAEAKRLTPDHLIEVKRAWRRVFDLLRDNLAELRRAGRMPMELDPSFAAFAAIGMCSWVANWYDNSKAETATNLAATMNHIFFQGVLSKRA